MNKHLLALVFSFTFISSSYAQYNQPSKYLVKQNFPDSALSVSLYEHDGTSIKFSELLSKYKGKKVVIDFWASWCRDCFVGLPQLNKLQRKSKNKDVVYIFISVDEEDRKWKYAINQFSLKGDHYRFTNGWRNTLSNYIDLDWIPRYLVLNEQGQIILPKSISIQSRQLANAVLKK